MSENRQQLELSALGDQLTCRKCSTITRPNQQPQSSCLLPPAGHEPSQNVPLATLDNTTTQVPLANNTESTPANSAGELMRHILHDIKKLKTAIIRQGATRDDRAKRHHADVDELHQEQEEHRTRRRASRSLSDDNDQHGHLHHDKTHSPVPTTTSHCRVAGCTRVSDDDRQRNVHRRIESLQPPTTQRSSRWNESTDVDRRNCDRSPRISSRPQHEHRPSKGPPQQFVTSIPNLHGYARPTLPPYQPYQHLFQQQPHPQQSQQQFQPQVRAQPMQSYPHYIAQQLQPSAFKPIHQMSPAERQPLVFLPIGQHQQQQQRQQRRQFHDHSTEVATRPSRLSGAHQS